MNKTIIAALVGSAVLAGAVGVAAAQDADGGDHPRLEALCARVPQARERLEHLEARITADADTAGSAAWLRARADEAEAGGHERAAAALRHRADRREARVTTIEVRLDRLDRAADRCGEAGLG